MTRSDQQPGTRRPETDGDRSGTASGIASRMKGVVRRWRRDLLAFGGRRGIVRPLRWWYGIDEVRDTDLFVISYPRSGNTWTRYILAYLDRGVGAALGGNDVNAIVPDAYQSAGEINAKKGRRIIKIHDPFFDACPRIIHVHRDPRESLVSFWFYQRRRVGYGGSFSEFLRGPRPAQHGSWKQHMRGCRRQLAQRPDSILVIRYQDLYADFIATARRLADWTGIGAGVDLEEVRRLTTLKSMAADERVRGSEFNATTGRFFFDDAGEGLRWRDHWSAEDIAWLEQDRELLGLMEEFGYR